MHVCFFGDSLTLGTGDPEFRGWPSRLAQQALEAGTRLDVCNLGIRGNRSSDILARLAEEAPRRWPEGQDGRLVLSFGAADAAAPDGWPRVDAMTSLANARLILAQARALGRPFLWVGPPPMAAPDFNARTMALSTMYGRLAAEAGVDYLDVHGPLSKDGAYAADLAGFDGVHPGAAGYAMLAALVAAWAPWRAWLGQP